MTPFNDFNNAGSKTQASPRQCPFDADEYMDLMDEFDMSRAEKEGMLHALWHIVGRFVDIGFGEDSTQYILNMHKDASRDSEKLIKQFQDKNRKH